MQAGPYAVPLCRMYYADKIPILEDLWGKPVELYENRLIVDSQVYPTPNLSFTGIGEGDSYEEG